ncbi:hypothetical protein L1987_57018 [Smallanthus sonchifolius]|uniref:Uncharacterized protein n=1 Tax=Smallanthus sonchifolius TaxID=185202 RepID=A0ACB9DBW0_9ASTR|nr:hypothetical protein L1987_57018 [Smallanthus sonchifolius]
MAISRFLLISKNHKWTLLEKLVQLFAVGQNGLMALYDTLFSQGATLSNSGSLLDLRSIPIFNENNAISTRKALYEFLSFRITLVFIVLLSDVNGLYNGPPTNLRLKQIHIYVEQKPQKAIIFGDKSRMGRGGKDSKVKTASNAAAYSGTPIFIARYHILESRSTK